jgi:hypothetical protein
MSQITERLNEIMGLLDKKRDFYLVTLLENIGEKFAPEELYESKLKYTKKIREDAIHEFVLEAKIPVIDQKTILSVQKELNRLIERKAEFINLKRYDLVTKTDKTIDYLEKFLKKYNSIYGKVKSFPTNSTKLFNAVYQAIYRSIEKIESKDKTLADELKKRLCMKPKIYLAARV